MQADPRSPERGQYAFLQDIVKRVAYETLSLRDRKAKHLAAAEFLLSTSGDEDEFVEVVAAHYVDALESAPTPDDAGQIRERAREMLVRAAERAGSLAAHAEAQRSFERAAALTDDPLVEARAPRARRDDGPRSVPAARSRRSCFERAIALFESRRRDATRPPGSRPAWPRSMWDLGRLEDGLERMNRVVRAALERRAGRGPRDPRGAAGEIHVLRRPARPRHAADRVGARDGREPACCRRCSPRHSRRRAILLTVHGATRRGPRAASSSRSGRHSSTTSRRRPCAPRTTSRTASARADRYAEATEIVRNGLAQARRVGNRYWELSFLGQLYPFLAARRVGRGAGDVRGAAAGRVDGFETGVLGRRRSSWRTVYGQRGELDELRLLLDRFAPMDQSGDEQERSVLPGRAGAAPACQRRSDGGAGVGRRKRSASHDPLRIRRRARQGRLYAAPVRPRSLLGDDGEAR